jgi:fatty acid desaturase
VPTLSRSTAPGDLRVLTRQVRAAGLLRRRPGWYSAKISVTLLSLLAGWVLLFVIGDSWWAMLDAAALAVLTTQVVFLGHDAGHQQISSRPATNRRLGLIFGNLLTGLCLGWWVPKHTAHHTHPNHIGLDPDIGPGVVAFTPDVARRRQRGVARLLLRWQSPLFFPLLLLEGVALQVAGCRFLVRRRDRAALIEAALLVVHLALFLGLVATVLSPLRAVVFIAVQQCLFGLYLGSTFAPNHKGMEIIGTDTELSFAERQIRTSRNVVGGRATTLALGGLNFQIEHHLFPTMPRPNLVRARSLVQAYCAEHDLPYTETGLIGSYRRVLGHLATVGGDDPVSRPPLPGAVVPSLS